MRPVTFFLLLLLLCSQTVSGQKMSFEMTSFPNIVRNYKPNLIVPYSGVRLNLKHGKRNDFEFALSFRSTVWGSEVSLSEGFATRILDREKVFVDNTSRLFISWPTFYNKISFSTALSNAVILYFKDFQRIAFSAGIRFNLNPSYAKISSQYFFSESQFGIRITLWK